MKIQNHLWIQNPLSDIVLYGYIWIIVFSLLLLFPDNYPTIILIVLLFNYVHRHYTFALVYGESEEFNKHRPVYIGLPVLCLIITYFFVQFDKFSILVTASLLWTIYHTVAQKYGFTRIYSRKAGYGDARTDMWIIYSWVIFIFFSMLFTEQDNLLKYRAGRLVLGYISDYMHVVKALAGVSLVASIYFTVRYIYIEYKNREKISIPKNLYVLSILLMYTTFFHSVIVGFIVLGFSHAVEYISFVNYFVNKKYRNKPDSNSLLARVNKKLWLYSGLFAIGVIALSLTGRHFDKQALSIYIVGTSFLHFTYDGLIWKVRKPDVGRPLDIKYKPT